MGVDHARHTGRNLATLPAVAHWYAEDFAAGDWMHLGSVEVNRDDIVEFARRFDPLPIHTDGANSVFDDVVASGIHTMALYSSLLARRFHSRLAIIAGKGLDQLRLPHPVHPGAILTGYVEVVEIVMRRLRADLVSQSTFFDEQGQLVLSFTGITVVARRDGSDESTASRTRGLPRGH